MRLKSIIVSAFTALMVACPVLAFSESADFDDSVPDTDETMTMIRLPRMLILTMLPG